MFIASFVAGPWAANCYLVAVEAPGHCVVIDPGVGAMDGLHQLIDEHDLQVAGVLLTHGHIDHVGSAYLVSGEFGVPTWIHAADRHLLTHPAKGLSPQGASMIAAMIGSDLPEPDHLNLMSDGDRISVAGLDFEVSHAPGHTAGSVLLSTAYPDDPAISGLIFSGDVLFHGSIGRTDLPGGDPAAMRRSLIDRVLTLPDSAVVLPGHGDTTSVERERQLNPYLQAEFLGA